MKYCFFVNHGQNICPGQCPQSPVKAFAKIGHELRIYLLGIYSEGLATFPGHLGGCESLKWPVHEKIQQPQLKGGSGNCIEHTYHPHITTPVFWCFLENLTPGREW